MSKYIDIEMTWQNSSSVLYYWANISEYIATEMNTVWQDSSPVCDELLTNRYLGTISLKHLGGKIAPKLVYFVLEKVLLTFSEMAPRWKKVKVQVYSHIPLCMFS